LLLFSILLPSILIAQEQLTFVAVRDNVAYPPPGRIDWSTSLLGLIVGETILLRTGDTITTAEVVYGFITILGETRHHLVIYFGEPSNSYAVFAKDFRPLNTEDVFGEDIFIDHPYDRFEPAFGDINIGDVDAMWVPYYYADILLSQSRDSLLEIHPYFINYAARDFFWYERSIVNIRHGRAMFYNSAIMLGLHRTPFAVRNIIRTDFGYAVDCVVSTFGYAFLERPERTEEFGTSFWDTYWLGDTVILFLHIDGDYLDIYTADSNIHLGTFIRVGREFITQYQSLIRTNISDLTNVQWPQRAEGSTGIPPVFVVPDNFRHETLEVTDEPVNNDVEDQESAIAQNDTMPLPLWLWFAIIGGVVVIVAVAVMLFIRRKR